MAFGLSFGMNKSKGSSTTDVNKTETTDQTQTGSQTTSGSTSTTGAQSTQTAQQTSGATTNQQATTGSQSTTQQATQFSEPVLGSLESTVQALLGTLPGTPSSRTDSFDHTGFVEGGTAAAASRINSDLENSLNSMFDQFGGRDDQNSMSALLANRTRGDAAAQIAGVRSSLEGQAQGIEKDRFASNLAGVGQQEGFLSQILDALKGGRSAATADTATASNTAGGTQNTQSTTGSENTQMSQDQTTQQIVNLLNQLTGTTNTTGTETTKTKNSSMGGGAGLSI